MDAGLLPVKHLDRAKARLAPHLDAATRRELAEALLADALSLAGRADFLDWWVVSDDAEVLERASERGLHAVRDAGTGLNDAIAAAIAEIGGSGSGPSSVTILPCDVPLARVEDLHDIVDTGSLSDVVLVPANDGGTNALFLSPIDALAVEFGPASLSKHARAGAVASLRCTILPLPRLEIDLDTPEDVVPLLELAGGGGGATVDLLTRLRARFAG